MKLHFKQVDDRNQITDLQKKVAEIRIMNSATFYRRCKRRCKGKYKRKSEKKVESHNIQQCYLFRELLQPSFSV